MQINLVSIVLIIEIYANNVENNEKRIITKNRLNALSDLNFVAKTWIYSNSCIVIHWAYTIVYLYCEKEKSQVSPININ